MFVCCWSFCELGLFGFTPSRRIIPGMSSTLFSRRQSATHHGRVWSALRHAPGFGSHFVLFSFFSECGLLWRLPASRSCFSLLFSYVRGIKGRHLRSLIVKVIRVIRLGSFLIWSDLESRSYVSGTYL